MKRLIILYPFLFALYPVLFLYAQNTKEFREQVLIIPLLIALGFGAISYLVTKLIFRKTEIAGVVSSFIIFVALSYDRILEVFEKITISVGPIHLTIEQMAPFICIILLALVILLSIRYQTRLYSLQKVLAVFGLVLIFFQLFSIIKFEITSKRLWTKQIVQEKITTNKTNISKDQPDIYYFIFDRYAGPTSLKQEYTYDNSDFYSYLTKKGFYIAEGATTNYPKTFLSLASSLNMEYLNFLTAQTHGGASSDESVVTPLIQNNKVLKFLKSKGYSYINVGSWWSPTQSNPNADINFYLKNDAYIGADEFTTGFLNTTIAAPILKYIFRDPTAISKDPQNNIHRSNVLYEFNAFNQIPQIPGPKFVFAHILTPHDPFVFDKNCTPITEEEVEKYDHVTNYLNQMQCANKKIITMLNTILKNSATPPVILFQSDEGPFPMIDPLPPHQSWATAGTTALKEKFPNFIAYYLPGVSTEGLYQSITPVNSFRMVFNKYFNTKYQLLPDINYIFQDENNYYKFTDVTEKVKE